MPGARATAAPCLFCEIGSGRAPAQVVFEDEKTMAFLDLFPVTRGHLLVIPKRHVDRLTDLSRSEYAEILGTVSQVCRRVERLSTHYNVSMNQGTLAGQIVFHLHFHVIPRYEEGTPQWSHPRARLTDREGAELLDVLRPE